MRIAYLDCFSGISGDMFLGALLDAGVPAQVFERTVAALDIGARLEISRVNRSGISASKIDVLVNGEKELPREVYWEQQGHRHEHTHGSRGDGATHGSDSSRAGSPAPHDHGRSLREIKQIISAAGIGTTAKATAVQIFEALGTAEAKVHNRDIESIHFHEVGAVDAMVDIVCAAVGAEELDVNEWVCSPLNVGGGMVKCAHGTFPVPAPATVELLQGAPVFSSGRNVELVTPTGAAIVKTLASRFGSFPEMRVQRAGYGAGTRDFSGLANVLRLTIGETEFKPDFLNQKAISVLEANLDDLNPQVFGYVLDRLLEEGALDVFGVPVQMKKNRPGMLLTVLCRPEDASKLSQVIFAETTTLGVRRREERREVLSRRWVSVETRWGSVRMKVAEMKGVITNYAPEYEDCRQIAAEHRVPLKAVMQAATQQYLASNQFTTKDTKVHEG
ncbi:MAG TPA: nickel pincer cofactor biosynthesis protein LarC [Terriglobales bacterium]|nr:nickel pincer cofactor biosynthesis protein LarC [Terriglobales bacterium]